MGLAAVGLGGNLGDIRSAFANARRDLAALPGTRLIISSSIYQTKAVGPPQPDYLNAALLLKSDSGPLELLRRMRKIEIRYGRVRHEYWGARTLDLDLIAFDALILDSGQLILPHPRMHERMFVLQPMCEIWPDWQHPRLRKSAKMMLHELIESGETPLAKAIPW